MKLWFWFVYYLHHTWLWWKNLKPSFWGQFWPENISIVGIIFLCLFASVDKLVACILTKGLNTGTSTSCHQLRSWLCGGHIIVGDIYIPSCRPFPLQLHQYTKFAHIAKSPKKSLTNDIILILLTVWTWQRRQARGGRGGLNHWITTVFVDQPLASPRSAMKSQEIVLVIAIIFMTFLPRHKFIINTLVFEEW